MLATVLRGAKARSDCARPILLFVLAMQSLGSVPSFAREYDPDRPWYLEGSIGTVQPGPGTDFGSGQNYSAHVGFELRRGVDVGLSLSWADARSTSQAIEADVLSGGIRGRGWVSVGRWSPYGEIGARAYRFVVKQLSVLAPSSDRSLRAGGHVGLGILYARSTWWGGLGAELHGTLGSPVLDEEGLVTFTTYQVFVGQSFGR